MKESNFVVKTSAVTIMVVVTLLFAAFIGGFALGRGSDTQSVRVSALPAASAATNAAASVNASTAPSPTEQSVVSFPLNINTATVEQLQQIPGIGAVLAQRIVDYREEFGLFRSTDELLEVNGIGEKTLAALRPYITIS